MKRLLFIALCSIQFANAQDSLTSGDIMNRKNEIRTDLLSLALQTKFNLSYERFLNKDYSVGVFTGFASSNKIDEDFDSGYRNNSPKYEVNPFVRYNLSKSQTSFYFAEVFVSVNGGDLIGTVRGIDDECNADYINEKSEYSDVGIGAGLGYKLYLQEKFAVELEVGFGSNLFNRDKSPDTLSRVGLSFGYRF
jgi:hypothetical protein